MYKHLFHSNYSNTILFRSNTEITWLLEVYTFVICKLLIITGHSRFYTTNRTFKQSQSSAPETCRKSTGQNPCTTVEIWPNLNPTTMSLVSHSALQCRNWSIKPAGHKPGKHSGSKQVLTAEIKCTFVWCTAELNCRYECVWSELLTLKQLPRHPNNKSPVSSLQFSPRPLSHNQLHVPSFYHSPIQQPQ